MTHLIAYLFESFSLWCHKAAAEICRIVDELIELMLQHIQIDLICAAALPQFYAVDIVADVAGAIVCFVVVVKNHNTITIIIMLLFAVFLHR